MSQYSVLLRLYDSQDAMTYLCISNCGEDIESVMDFLDSLDLGEYDSKTNIVAWDIVTISSQPISIPSGE